MNSELASSHSLPATGSDEVLVRVEGVSKKFCRSLKRSLWYGLCDIAGELNPFARYGAGSIEQRASSGAEGGSNQLVNRHTLHVTPAEVACDEDLRDGEFHAVRGVSFELRRGECIGLIGHNGAGKTTLLRMLNGLIKPDHGRIEMNGRVGALIALGAGFNPILTGRENIYINGSVLGLSKKEIDEKIEEIIDFAEIGEFIDMPVQNYSSGMSVRLGFSIASSLSPDVLILDEVLAVGDIGFVIKCLNRVRRMTADAAVILVTHQMQFISSFCTRVIFMDRGCTVLDTSSAGEAIDKYYQMVKTERNETGTMQAAIEEVVLAQGDQVRQGADGLLKIRFKVEAPIRAAILHIYVMDEAMSPIICHPVTDNRGAPFLFAAGSHMIEVPLGSIDLVPGKYSFTLSLSDEDSKKSLLRSQGLHEFRVIADRADWGRVVRPVRVS
jgi:lipopolysaccharide transport system ATP-binding protein